MQKPENDEVLGLVFQVYFVKRVVPGACVIMATRLAFCTRKQREMPAISNVQPLAFPSVSRSSLEKEDPLPFVSFLLFSQLTVSHSLFAGGFYFNWLICCWYCVFTVSQPSLCTLVDCQGDTGTDVCRCHWSLEKQRSFRRGMTHLIIRIWCIGAIWR